MPRGNNQERTMRNRRTLLKTVGVATVGGLAGCLGDDDDDEDDDPADTADDADDDPADTADDADDDVPADVSMGGELVLGFAENVSNWDPTVIGDVSSQMAVSMLVYEDLVTFDFDGNIHPSLATDWEQIDDTTFRFDLREGVEFHNGEEFHAEQVVRSFERYEGQPNEADVFTWYENGEVIDDHEVEIELQQVDALFLEDVWGIPILPDELLDADEAGENIDNVDAFEPVGTAPYQFEEFRDDNLYRVTSFPDHWFEGSDEVPAEPPIEEVTFQIVREDAARVSALRTEDIDISYDLPADTYDDFDASDDFVVASTSRTGYDFLGYPLQYSPWDNQWIRRGCNHLIPRPIIAEDIYGGWKRPAYTIVAPVSDDFYDEDFSEEMRAEYNEWDEARGVELVERGFEEEDVEPPLETRMVVNADDSNRVEWVNLVAQAFEDTGLFDVDVETFEWGAYLDRILAEDTFEREEIIAVGTSQDFDPDGYFRTTLHPDSIAACCNFFHFDESNIVERIDAGRFDPDLAFDHEARIDHYFDLQEDVFETMPYSYVNHRITIDVLNNDLRNWELHPYQPEKMGSGLYLPQAGHTAWLEES